jgi:hypothetical protein
LFVKVVVSKPRKEYAEKKEACPNSTSPEKLRMIGGSRIEEAGFFLSRIKGISCLYFS